MAAGVAGDGPHRGRQRQPVAMGGDQPDSWEQEGARNLPGQRHGVVGARSLSEGLHGGDRVLAGSTTVQV